MNKHKALPLLLCGNFQVWTLPRASYNFHSHQGLGLSRIPHLFPAQHCCCVWRARYSSCLGVHRSARASWRGYLEVGLGFLCIVRKSPQVFLMCPLGAASLLRIPELEREGTKMKFKAISPGMEGEFEDVGDVFPSPPRLS